VDARIVELLGIKGRPIKYTVSTMTTCSVQREGHEVDLVVSSPACLEGATLRNVWTSPALNLPCDSAATASDVARFDHLSDLQISDVRGRHAQLLIGVGSGLLQPLEVRLPPAPEQPYAERTQLGWVVRGPSGRPASNKQHRSAETNFVSTQNDSLDNELSQLWNNDFPKLPNADRSCMSVEDRQAQHIADVFWRRWNKEYVPQLIARQKLHSKRRNMQVGDIVLIADQSLPRGKWPLGIVESMAPERDGLVRSAVVRTSKSQLTRPMTQLALLDGALADDHQ
jgi:hypothetical protein